MIIGKRLAAIALIMCFFTNNARVYIGEVINNTDHKIILQSAGRIQSIHDAWISRSINGESQKPEKIGTTSRIDLLPRSSNAISGLKLPGDGVPVASGVDFYLHLSASLKNNPQVPLIGLAKKGDLLEVRENTRGSFLNDLFVFGDKVDLGLSTSRVQVPPAIVKVLPKKIESEAYYSIDIRQDGECTLEDEKKSSRHRRLSNCKMFSVYFNKMDKAPTVLDVKKKASAVILNFVPAGPTDGAVKATIGFNNLVEEKFFDDFYLILKNNALIKNIGTIHKNDRIQTISLVIYSLLNRDDLQKIINDASRRLNG